MNKCFCGCGKTIIDRMKFKNAKHYQRFRMNLKKVRGYTYKWGYDSINRKLERRLK